MTGGARAFEARAQKLGGGITGASSGIGRAAAVRFAGRGARLVLAARAEAPLLEVRRQCTALGAQALVASTDVRDESAVRRLATSAVEHYGQIDVDQQRWRDRLWAVRSDSQRVFRAVLDTNLFGQVHGSRAVLRISPSRNGSSDQHGVSLGRGSPHPMSVPT